MRVDYCHFICSFAAWLHRSLVVSRYLYFHIALVQPILHPIVLHGVRGLPPGKWVLIMTPHFGRSYQA